jgi:acyl-CoA dehydrogenase
MQVQFQIQVWSAGEYEGAQVLGLRMNFSKRWITLAPIATVVGLAFKLYDPEGLLGDKTKLNTVLPVP